MSAPIYTYSATELAELARLNDAERAARAAWDVIGALLDVALRNDLAAYEIWATADKALNDYAMSLSAIDP